MQPSETVKKYSIILIALAALAAHYPVLSAPFSTLDDYTLLEFISPEKNVAHKTIINIFTPHSIDRYYRPLLLLSFIIDSRIWGNNPFGYHLTNYILHCLNSIILYFILSNFFLQNCVRPLLSAGTLINESPSALSPVTKHPDHTLQNRIHISALAGALLFAVHPLSCESVAWISGRTDILACFFCLLSFYFYLCNFKGRGLLCAVFFLAALFSKESALALYPIIVLVHISVVVQKGRKAADSIASILGWIITLSIPLLVYIYLRMDGVNALDNGVKTALSNNISADAGAGGFNLGLLQYITAVIAFYIKKLFIPVPLNFAISNINIIGYSVFFLIILSGTGYLAVRKEWRFAVWGGLLIVSFLPALPVATSKMAWMPFAERYLYLSIAVWTFFPAMILHRVTIRKAANPIICITFAIIPIFFFITFSRAMLWNDNQRLWADTYRKNPKSSIVLYKYGELLGPEKGAAYFQQSLENNKDDEQLKALSLLALARHSLSNDDYASAVDYVDGAIEIGQTAETFLSSAKILHAISGHDSKQRVTILRKMIYCYEAAYSKQKKPDTLYRTAILYEMLNDTEVAQDLFLKLTKKFPGDHYAELATSKLKGINPDGFIESESGS